MHSPNLAFINLVELSFLLLSATATAILVVVVVWLASRIARSHTATAQAQGMRSASPLSRPGPPPAGSTIPPAPEAVRQDARSCPRCGTEVSPEAASGLCPRCLLGAGISTQPTAPVGEAAPLPDPKTLAESFPQFEILGRIGQGGMGVVYKARQRKLDRVVALKVLPREASRDPAFTERFHREARALARLNHPNIVTVYDFGEADGLFFLVMEYMEGPDLRRVLQQGRLSPSEALRIVPVICDALQYAHGQGVVHRDIKPGNILLDDTGRVKIADFGIAKLAGSTAADVTLTQSRQTVGTPHYMAPEQVENPQVVDHRADIYSLGVVFYEMLTGELPLGRFAPPSRRVQVDVRFDDVVLRALEKEPERRYQHAGDVKSEVERISTAPGVPDAVGHQSTKGGLLPGWRLGTRPLSRPVVTALAWIALFPLGLLKMLAGGSGPTRLPDLLLTSLALVALLAPPGATLLGMLGLREIVQARGKLAGLRGAVFATLFFPLLTLAALGCLVVASLVSATMGGVGEKLAVPVALVTTGLATLLLAVGATRRLARAARQACESEGDLSRLGWGWKFAAPGTTLFIETLVALMLLLLFSRAVSRQSGALPAMGVPFRADAPNPYLQSLPGLESWTWGGDGPALAEDFANIQLGLSGDKRARLEDALKEAYLRYQRHLSNDLCQVTRTPAGHEVIRVTAQPSLLDQVEDQFWSDADALLDRTQQTTLRGALHFRPAGQELDPQGPAVFPFGDRTVVLEWWRVGSWFHWRIQPGAPAGTVQAGELDAAVHRSPEMPGDYQRLVASLHGGAAPE